MMGRMTRLWAAVGAVLTAFVISLAPAAASATPEPNYPDIIGREITRWDQTFELRPDGGMDVRLEIDFDFGNDPGHGPYMTLPVRQGYNEKYDRVYRITNFRATSPTGAPSHSYKTEERNWLTVRIGDQNIGNVSGVQTYVITWTVHKVMNDTTAEELGGVGDEVVNDELYWNAIGDGWVIPISHATVTVKSPVPVIASQCFAGSPYSQQACTSVSVDGTEAVFTQRYLYPGQPFTVNLLYPPHSFDTTPALIERNDVARAFRLTPVTGFGSLAVFIGGLLIVARRFRVSGMDEEYKGLTPGLMPVGNNETQVGLRDKFAPLAVQFEPPAGLRPGQLGTLIDERADPRDVTATIVDLAVRGYLRIDPVGQSEGKEPKDYTLVKLRQADPGLVPYEMTIFTALFAGRDSVKLKTLKTTFSGTMASAQSQLYADVTKRGWFRRNPQYARATWYGVGFAITLGGFILMFFLAAATSLALFALAIMGVGIAILFVARHAPGRTPEGTAILKQTQGFEHFIATADANQLRYEEGHDIFSRYLPFAIAFGLADKWAAKFAELARQGANLPDPTWYGSSFSYGTFWGHASNFGNDMARFTSLADSAISAPAPGSSGGSGFSSSGGGGFSGGGGGGGGGGGW